MELRLRGAKELTGRGGGGKGKEGGREGARYRWMDRGNDRQTHPTNTHVDKHSHNRQIKTKYKQTGIQTLTYKQTDGRRQTDRQAQLL